MESSNYTAEEEARIVETIRSGGTPSCPRCASSLSSSDVEPRPEVAYVRRRRWLVCSGCGRSLVVDRRRLR